MLDEQRSLVASISMSFKRLPAERQRRFAELAVFPASVRFGPEPASRAWGLDLATTRKELIRLHAAGILQRSRPGAMEFYLHDTLRSYARTVLCDTGYPEMRVEGCSLPPETIHERLVDNYLAESPGGTLAEVPDDGYLHDHLVWHLEQASREDSIHDLLRHESDGGNTWFRTRQASGSLSGYAYDLSRGFELARSRTASPDRILLYALSRASTCGTLPFLTPEVMKELLRRKLWTLDQLREHVDLLGREARAAELRAALAVIAMELDLVPGDRQEVVSMCQLAAAAGNNDLCVRAAVLAAQNGAPFEASDLLRGRCAVLRARLLSALASDTDPSINEMRVLGLLELFQAEPDDHVFGFLSSLAPELWSRDVASSYLAALQERSNEVARSSGALVVLRRLLQRGDTSLATTASQYITEPSCRVRALAKLYSRAPGESSRELRGEIVDILGRLDWAEQRENVHRAYSKARGTVSCGFWLTRDAPAMTGWLAELIESLRGRLDPGIQDALRPLILGAERREQARAVVAGIDSEIGPELSNLKETLVDDALDGAHPDHFALDLLPALEEAQKEQLMPVLVATATAKGTDKECLHSFGKHCGESAHRKALALANRGWMNPGKQAAALEAGFMDLQWELVALPSRATNLLSVLPPYVSDELLFDSMRELTVREFADAEIRNAAADSFASAEGPETSRKYSSSSEARDEETSSAQQKGDELQSIDKIHEMRDFSSRRTALLALAREHPAPPWDDMRDAASSSGSLGPRLGAELSLVRAGREAEPDVRFERLLEATSEWLSTLGSYAGSPDVQLFRSALEELEPGAARRAWKELAPHLWPLTREDILAKLPALHPLISAVDRSASSRVTDVLAQIGRWWP